VIVAPSTCLQEEVPAVTQNTATTQEDDSRDATHDATPVHPPADPVGNSEHYHTRAGLCVSKPAD